MGLLLVDESKNEEVRRLGITERRAFLRERICGKWQSRCENSGNGRISFNFFTLSVTLRLPKVIQIFAAGFI